MMLDELQSLGVAFVALHEQIDCTTATGQLMLHLLGAFAEFERALIRERVKAGLAHARAKGQRLGRPRLKIGKRYFCKNRKGLKGDVSFNQSRDIRMTTLMSF